MSIVEQIFLYILGYGILIGAVGIVIIETLITTAVIIIKKIRYRKENIKCKKMKKEKTK